MGSLSCVTVTKFVPRTYFFLDFLFPRGREFVKLPHGAVRTGSLNFCMVPFEAGKLQFNGILSFWSASKPFSAGLFR